VTDPHEPDHEAAPAAVAEREGATIEPLAPVPAPTKKPTSERQRIANIENAKRSTGPTTQAGKAIASMNRLSHGLHATREVAITRGVFREEHLDVVDFIAGIIAGLKPRDPQELLQARRVAMAYLWNERLERYQSAAVQGDAMLSNPTLVALGDPGEIDYHEAILEVLAELLEEHP
jgi:hypothetical protein